MKKIVPIILFFVFAAKISIAQNALQIPPSLTGTTFNLNIQSGTQTFYSGYSTITYGINQNFLAPTIIVNKGDNLSFNIHNALTETTTLHWHGLHVPAMMDGGTHEVIAAGGNWNPSFTIKNNAGTFWYHPHGAGHTDPQVSMGLAGMFIVHDAAELALNIPHTYGTDDIPLIVQTKEIDVLKHFTFSTTTDTAIFINGTLNPYYNAPAQVLRFRLLNGSSMRTFYFGFSNNQIFKQIATDGGLLDSTVSLTRLRLSPGERAEILVDFSSMIGQTIYLKSYASQLPNGIYGAAAVGISPDTIPYYNFNFLNGVDFNLMKINVVAATTGALHSMPSTLLPFQTFNPSLAVRNRKMIFDTLTILASIPPNRAEGSFGINRKTYNMDTINFITYLNDVETYTLINKTLVAHPFHIHGMYFNVLEKSGLPTPPTERGLKDVVLVMPNDSVKFVTQWLDFADNTMPYMYHCHLLHHEDDGMMGQFLVLDTTNNGINNLQINQAINIFPNPCTKQLSVCSNQLSANATLQIFDIFGRKIIEQQIDKSTNQQIINSSNLSSGIYFIKATDNKGYITTTKFIKQ
ncbi:MAG: hypothetical protein RJA07_1522 [Bacteroidota bacterium]|jgi:bilirubin oxidase